MTTTTRTTGPIVPSQHPALDGELGDLIADLYGFDPDFDQVLDAFAALLTKPRTTQGTWDALNFLAGNGPSLMQLLGLAVARLGDSHQNPALRGLPAAYRKAVRQLTAEYAAHLDPDNGYDRGPLGNPAETAALIEEGTAHSELTCLTCHGWGTVIDPNTGKEVPCPNCP